MTPVEMTCIAVCVISLLVLLTLVVCCTLKKDNTVKDRPRRDVHRRDVHRGCSGLQYERFKRRGELSCPQCGLECNDHQLADAECKTCACIAPWTGEDCNTCPDGFGGPDCVPNSDCEGQWNEPSECDKDCGGGTQTLTYNITKEKKGDGQNCEVQNGSTKTQICNTEECPID